MLPETELARHHVEAAYTKVVAKGVKPFETRVVIDSGARAQRRAMQINKCPTIAHRHDCTQGYSVSTKGVRIGVSETAMLQGRAPGGVDWRGAAASPSVYAGWLGHAQSLHVAVAVSPHRIYCAMVVGMPSYRH